MSEATARGPCRHRRGRQLREQPRPGRRVLPDADPTEAVPGLMHVVLGGYHVRRRRVRRRVRRRRRQGRPRPRQGHLRRPEQHDQVRRRRPTSASTVQRGPTFDGLGKFYRETVEESPAEPVDVAQALRDAQRRRARELPARSAPRTRSATTRRPASTPASASSTPSRCSSPATPCGRRSSPTPASRSSATTSRARSAPPSCTASSPASSRTAAWRSTARTSSTSAATWTSRTCSSASASSRRRSRKTQSVTSQIDQGIAAENVHIGPSDHVPWLDDRKWAYIRLEGRNFGDVPLNVELKLEVWDSPNSAGVIIDAVRCCQGRARPRHRRPAARPVGVLHEVAAGAVPRRRAPTSMVEEFAGRFADGARARCAVTSHCPRRTRLRTRVASSRSREVLTGDRYGSPG